MQKVGTLVIGAGPTGLGAAYRLEEHKHDWLLVDAFLEAGGLAATDTTPEGFLVRRACPGAPPGLTREKFDLGGHVIFSHFDYFDDVLQLALGPFEDAARWATHQRESYVRYKDVWVPYPLQNNLCVLPVEDQVVAINGMVGAKVKAATNPAAPRDFDEWIVSTMGAGMADLFMRPYNFKVWAIPPALMQWSWLGERVSVVDTERAIANVLLKRLDTSWGPNAIFRFPCRGGTGAIWKAVAALLPAARMHFGSRVVAVDLDARVATMQHADGRKYRVEYERVLSTAPLDLFVQSCTLQDAAAKQALLDASSRLKYSSTHIIGLGIRGANPHGTKCWLYFHEANCPFYRATIFSNYGPGNVPPESQCLPTIRLARGGRGPDAADASPRPGPYWCAPASGGACTNRAPSTRHRSLMLEVSESPYKPVDLLSVVEDTIRGCTAAGLLAEDAQLVSIYHRRVERGYPTPSLERDSGVHALLPLLRGLGVWSRGRFGSWKYEIGNQDHSLALGVEAADNMLAGCEEVTLTKPGYVNRNVGSAKNATPEFARPPALAPPRVVLGAEEFAVAGRVFGTNVKALARRWFSSLEEFAAYSNGL
jgi:protoporphyrinogen oxidase